MLQKKHIVIAIDGYSSCGKSTLAQDMADALGFVHIDSGAMYRAVSLAAMDAGIGYRNAEDIIALMDSLVIEFDLNGSTPQLSMNGVLPGDRLRTPAVSEIVSQVSAIPEVREQLVRMQRAMSTRHDVVMEGRDIGTVVFPEADLKLFLTADLEIRIDRRWHELQAKGIQASREQVRENLLLRDHIDSTRAIAPLRKAADAFELDNSQLSRSEQLNAAIELAKTHIPSLHKL